MEAEEDERREAAISSTPSLQPNFKPQKSPIAQAQLSKFQELHKRRLQLKARSKIKTKSKGGFDGMGKSHGINSNSEECVVEKSSKINEDSSLPFAKCSTGNTTSSLQQDNVAAQLMSTKRQKLHWGLDTKERWERKSNM